MSSFTGLNSGSSVSIGMGSPTQNPNNINNNASKHIVVNTNDTYAFFKTDVSKNCRCKLCKCGHNTLNLSPSNKASKENSISASGMYMYMYVLVYVYVYVFIYIYICMYMYMYICICLCL